MSEIHADQCPSIIRYSINNTEFERQCDDFSGHVGPHSCETDKRVVTWPEKWPDSLAKESS